MAKRPRRSGPTPESAPRRGDPGAHGAEPSPTPSGGAAGASFETLHTFNESLTHARDRRELIEIACRHMAALGWCRRAWVALEGDAWPPAGTASDATRFPLTRDDRTVGILGVEGPNPAAGPDILARAALHIAAVMAKLERQEEHARAEEALRESEARYRAIFEASGDAIFCIGPDARFRTVNQVAAQMMRLSPADLIGKHLCDVHPPPYAERHLAAVMHVFETGQPIINREVATQTAEDERWFSINLTPIRDASGAVASVMGVCRDLTEHKRGQEERRHLEEQLLQAQKMEAIGRLAGGVAHDFNNLLTAILGHAQLLAAQVHKDKPLHERAYQIVRAAERAAALTRQLLAFGRKQVLELTVSDVNPIVEDVKRMLERVIGEDIELVTMLAPGLDRVKIDRNQFEQILLNLAVNARDAMPGGGTITVETANVVLDAHAARAGVESTAGPFVLIAVSDTGHGMDAETVAHIFEPFFTTKKPGVGTGLGLSTVYGIVKQHRGHITVESAPGRGAIFRIYFPRAEAAIEFEAPARDDLPRRGRETLLVVEDEDGIRRLIAEGLAALGYHVLEAATPLAAEALCERHGGTVHLLVTDVVMPQMTGTVLADRLLHRQPRLKVLYISGYADTSLLGGERRAGDINFLQKPFTLDLLARRVRQVLDAPAPLT